MENDFDGNVWQDYIDRFDYFSINTIRDGCYPRALIHPEKVEQSIVLVHGLSDSPYYMAALGRHFHESLGYNVYMPLLHCHGLKDPGGMDSVSAEEWKANVAFAIAEAAKSSRKVSVGGLSTGGTLSYYMAVKNPQVSGDLYLFSAALDLARQKRMVPGNLIEKVVRADKFLSLPLGDILQKLESKGKQNLIGKNPYKYVAVEFDGLKQLSLLIKETDEFTAGFSKANPFKHRVFIAHSAVDASADIEGVKEFSAVCAYVDAFYIPASVNVSHAGLVLNKTIVPADSPQEANVLFDEMIDRIDAFVAGGGALV